MQIRVLIADDDPLIREGLQIILARDEEFKVAALAADGKQAVDACLTQSIDVALIDIRMPVINGVEAVKEITGRTQTKCIILTTFEEDDLIRDAVRNGARGYLLKGKGAQEIKNAVKLVYTNSTVFENSVFDKIQSTVPRVDETLFSEREVEIIELVSEGLTNREIASRLFLSDGTVKNYISSILSKLNLKQRTQIATYYYKGGAGGNQ